jgi:hypothetical protein
MRRRSCRWIASTGTFTWCWRTSAPEPAAPGARPTSKDTDRETVLRDLISGQYAYPVRIVAFNAIEGRSRDATGEVADELGERAAGNIEITPALRAFIEANATRPFAVQLALPLRGVA